MLRFAIVVPVGPMHEKVKRCLDSCRRLKYDNYVTVLVTDQPEPAAAAYDAVNVITGSDRMTGPAVKRDRAFRDIADADIYAFLDDDAYVDPLWLQRAMAVIESHPEADAFGGPGLMPDDQALLEQLSAAVMETWVGSGALRFRFAKDDPRYCDDFPAYNFMVRREALRRVGGWASELYGGEDTYICEKIVSAGGKIFYDPSLYVCHYRRAIWPKHAWQVFNIGRSRACFIREGAPTSRRPIYFLPAVASLLLIAAALVCITVPAFRLPGALVAVLAWTLVSLLAHRGRISPLVRVLLPIGLCIHHFSYAYGFAVGILTGRRNSVSGKRPVFLANQQ